MSAPTITCHANVTGFNSSPPPIIYNSTKGDIKKMWYQWCDRFYLPGILRRHYRKLRNLSRFLSSANVSLTARLGLARHADYLCDLHCFSHSLVLFCSLFGIFTLVLIHNEYRRGCNINKAQCLGCWVYLRIQIKRTMEVTESLHIHLMFSFRYIIYNLDEMSQVWYPNYRCFIN